MSIADNAKIYALFQLASKSPRIDRRYQTQSGTFSNSRPKKLTVKWVKYRKHGWCRLNTLNLEKVISSGVFIIWKPKNRHNVIRIGQGNIANQLHTLRNDPEITQFGTDLLVTWAGIPTKYRDGIERYLFEQYSPATVERVNCAPLVHINLP